MGVREYIGWGFPDIKANSAFLCLTPGLLWFCDFMLITRTSAVPTMVLFVKYIGI